MSVTGTSGSLSHGGTGTLTVNGNGPTAGSVSPSSGSGASQVFTFQFSDPKGYSNLSIVWFSFGSSPYAIPGCKVQYAPRANALYLNNESGTVVLGPVTPGIGGNGLKQPVHAKRRHILSVGLRVTPSRVKVGLTFETGICGACRMSICTHSTLSPG